MEEGACCLPACLSCHRLDAHCRCLCWYLLLRRRREEEPRAPPAASCLTIAFPLDACSAWAVLVPPLNSLPYIYGMLSHLSSSLSLSSALSLCHYLSRQGGKEERGLLSHLLSRVSCSTLSLPLGRRRKEPQLLLWRKCLFLWASLS